MLYTCTYLQSKKGRGKDDHGDAEADNDVDDELSRGIQALSMGGEAVEQNPPETATKISNKEHRRQEGTDKAEEGMEAEEKASLDKDKASKKASKKAMKSKTGMEEGEGEGHGDDGGQKKRSSKERKKSKQEVL